MRTVLLAFCISICAIVTVSAQIPYGFKGIQLGMTRDDVSAVMDSTEWGRHLTMPQNADAPIRGNEQTVHLCVRSAGMIMALTTRPGSLKSLACITLGNESKCAAFDWIAISFYRDSVYKIEVFNQWIGETPKDVSFYGTMAIEAMTKAFGRPTKVHQTMEQIAMQLARQNDTCPAGQSDTCITVVAEWRDHPGRVHQSITVVALKRNRSHRTDVKIILINERVAAVAARYQATKGRMTDEQIELELLWYRDPDRESLIPQRLRVYEIWKDLFDSGKLGIEEVYARSDGSGRIGMNMPFVTAIGSARINELKKKLGDWFPG